MTIGKNQYEGLDITPEYGTNIQIYNIDLLSSCVKNTGKIIDVGANIGVVSIGISQVVPYTEFICFELNKSSANIVGQNLTKCDIPHTVYNVALSDFDGECGAILTNNHQNCKLNKDISDTTVETKRLDFYGFDNVTLIKIDVEGHELEVLNGAIQTIQKNKPVILLEYHQEANSEKIFQIINDLEYEWISIEPDSQFFSNRTNQLLLTPKLK